MQDQNLFLRNDTMLGVCEAIGQDFGFHPNWLRIALCGAFFFNPWLVCAAYVGLGLFVALARLAFPTKTARNELPVAPQAPEAPAAPPATRTDDQAEMSLAA